MAKRTPGTAPVPQGNSAETILGLINSLPQGERSKLFRLLTSHPDNKPFADLHESYCILAKWAIPQLEKYKLGLRKRAIASQVRESLIRQYVRDGITNAKEIHAKLRKDAPVLATVEIKSIQNTLAELKKSSPQAP